MNTRAAYNSWAATYDAVLNKTRDMELVAGQEMLSTADFSAVLEIGCGTGKNTEWLSKKTMSITAVDFSEGMLAIAREKIKAGNVEFRQFDLGTVWDFGETSLVVCSLVLEHIENISFIFEQASKSLKAGGCFYICELHPYKQLEGSRAKFEQDGKLVQLEYFSHHIADFFDSAFKNGFQCVKFNEWFDDNDRSTTPRLVAFLFQKA